MTTESTSPDAPRELKEYEYYVGHMLLSAQMTEEQAAKVGAVPVGTSQEAPEPGKMPRKETERAASHMKAADAQGATNENEDPEALNKARDVRNRRPRS
jgi:hypothetical protein